MRTRMLIALAVLLGAGMGQVSSASAVEEGPEHDKQCWYRIGVDEETACTFCGDPCWGEDDGWRCCSINVE